jgi:hypothetical protein
MMRWNPFQHRQSEGALPLVAWNQSAFSFQASPGHNYDLWAWPYPAQTNQYTYFNAFYGNQLPNFNKYVPILEGNGNQQMAKPWITSTNRQQQNALQAGAPGSAPLLWGQQPTADYISSLGTLWSQGGGSLSKRRR